MPEVWEEVEEEEMEYKWECFFIGLLFDIGVGLVVYVLFHLVA